MESADQAVAEVGTSHICSSYPSCHLHVFSLKSWEPGGNHFLLTESLSLITQKTYSQQLMESLLWFVYNVSSHLLPSPLFCPSSTGPRWSPCSSKSALHANSPCWMPPLASLSGARLVRMIFFLPHPVPTSHPFFLSPCMSLSSQKVIEVWICVKAVGMGRRMLRLSCQLEAEEKGEKSQMAGKRIEKKF